MTFLIFSANLSWGVDIFLLTQPLQLSSTEDLKSVQSFSVSGQPTLLKKLSEKNGVTKVQLIQVNGVASQQIVYVSSKWFSQGTRTKAIDPFQIDPNKLIKDLTKTPSKNCLPNIVILGTQPIEENPDIKDPCHILLGEKNNYSEKQKEEIHMACFDNIKKKLNISYKNSAYQAIAKLYSLPKEQQIFMAQILTMYGEASGAVPPAEQMAAVLQIVDNRTRLAKTKYREANQLDVVLQNSQFSMFNPSDFNWKRAMFASKFELKTAVHVLVNREKYSIKSTGKNKIAKNVYHYMATELCGGDNHPAWAVDCTGATVVSVNGVKLEASNGHVFFTSIPWSFNPSNRYKTYAKKHEGVK